jgi:hypothetical protein
MDFDHLDSKTKKWNLSQWTRFANKELLLEEISKCEVVCSNCHRIRTYNRKLLTTQQD